MEKERKNYFIKMPTDFFKEGQIDWLLSQPNGCDYVIIFVMLVLMTANSHGLLAQKIGETKIMPFRAEKIKRDTAYFSLETIEKALELYRELDLICIREDGAMEINNYDRYVGVAKVSTDDYRKANAERQKRYREKKKAEKNFAVNSGVTLHRNVTDNVTNNVTSNDRYRYRDIDINNNDDDRVGKILPKNDTYNLSPKTEEDYQALVDEMLSTDPFERPDLKTSVVEEKNLIEEMFNSYDSQKVIRAMKKGKDNRAKSFTYARQILQKQGDTSTKPLKASKQELVIPCGDWDEMIKLVNSDARKDILEETPEEFRTKVLSKTKYYSCVEITDALRMARLELEQSFEGNEDEKVYSYFGFLLRFQGSLTKEAVANNVDPQSYILKKFSLLWEKQNE